MLKDRHRWGENDIIYILMLCCNDFSDGIIRVFTTNEERAADEDCQKAFEEDVASSSIPAQIGDIKTEDLVGPSALLSEGQFTILLQ